MLKIESLTQNCFVYSALTIIVVLLLQLFSCSQVPAVSFIENKDVPRLYDLGDGIFSGGTPSSDSGYAFLASLGVKVLVCVDGAKPDVEMAKKYGMKYVHIPIEYSDVTEHDQLSVKRLIKDYPDELIYVHCHHGRHRGPTMAAIALLERTSCSVDRALNVLEVAGTSLDYPGLWRDVRYWQRTNPDSLPELYSIAPLESFSATMALLDRNFDRVKLLRLNDWKVPATHPDLVVSRELQQTIDLLQDSKKQTPLEWASNEDFHRRMVESIQYAEELANAVANKKSVAARNLYEDLKSSCSHCHRKYRND
jgi:protein tyrosine phosphatase (PTP) superfamily phosphohydrolase (DUF442 family)